jgi:hypothetical protein
LAGLGGAKRGQKSGLGRSLTNRLEIFAGFLPPNLLRESLFSRDETQRKQPPCPALRRHESSVTTLSGTCPKDQTQRNYVSFYYKTAAKTTKKRQLRHNGRVGNGAISKGLCDMRGLDHRGLLEVCDCSSNAQNALETPRRECETIHGTRQERAGLGGRL